MCAHQDKQTRKPIGYDDRVVIEAGVNRGDRLSTIARTLGRTQKVVAEEIKRNWTSDPKGMLTVRTRNICVHAGACVHVDLCKKGCLQPCCRCKSWLCNSLCPDFEAEMCPDLERTPFCCNGCPKRVGFGCRYPYRFYEAKYADDLARWRKSDSRAGIDCSQEDFERAIRIIAEGLKKGQSPAHIIATNDGIPFSASTFYRLVDGGKAENIIKLNLPRAVRYRPRKKSSNGERSNIPREVLKGRTYDDFKNLDEALKESAVEMDTVVGRLGTDKQAILTLHFLRFHFQLFILLADKSAEEVVKALDMIDGLCDGLFSRIFPVILTDRGSEMADALRMENRANGIPRTRVFYCDALQSQQKPHAENNHKELRKILPKGKTNFDALTGRDMALCMSHVNSYCRKSINWWSPMSLATVLLPLALIDALGIEKIEPQDVNLTPYLVPHAMLNQF